MKKIVIYLSVIAMMCSMASCGKTEKKSALVGNGTESSQTEAKDKKDKTEAKDKQEEKQEAKKEAKAEENKADKKTEKTEQKDEKSSDGNVKVVTEGGDDEVVEEITPIFLLFVSKKDSNYDATMKNVKELQEKYKDMIVFDIRDIDEHPENKENFPVDGATPFLIMQNKQNNISAFQAKIADKAQMEAAITDALK